MGGDSRAGILLFVEEEEEEKAELQGCWLPCSPQAVVCGCAERPVTVVWSLEDSVGEVVVPVGRKKKEKKIL